MEDKNRLVEILKHIGARKNTLAKELGYTNGSVFYQIETGRNGISTSLARKITNRYPEINYEWILTGKGTMLIKPKETPVDSLLLKRVEVLERISEGQDARIKLQSLEIAAQSSRIENLEALFDTKKNLTPQSI